MILISLFAALALQIGNPNGGPTTQRPDEFDKSVRDRQSDQDSKGPAHPIFLKQPNGDDLKRVYPADALAKKLSGQAVVRCTVDKTGSFSKCKVESETPKNAGFGAAALELTKVFKLDPKASDGSSVIGLSMSLPMPFSPDMVQ